MNIAANPAAPMAFVGELDVNLWQACQTIVYGKIRSLHPPYAVEHCQSGQKPASWLYHTLAGNPELRQKVKAGFPASQARIARLM